MKILQLVTKRQFRGAEVFAAELSDMLAKNGHEVFFTGLYETSENVLSARLAQNIDLNGKRSGFINFSLLLKLLKLIRTIKPDIIQANGSDTLKYLVLAKKINPQIRIVYRNISQISSWTNPGGLKRKINEWMFRQVEFVTSVGQEPLNDLIRTYHFPANKTKVIKRGVPVLEFDSHQSRMMLSEEFSFTVTDPVLMHIGQFSPEKNHVFLVGCMEEIIKTNPAIRLIFIGEGNKEEEINSLIIKKNLSKNIFLAGYKNNVQEYLAGADLFLLGSTIEGLPGVIIEAAMQKVPAVAVNTGGVGEIVINGKTGLLLEKHDPAVFAQSVLNLLDHKQERERLGANAYAYATQNFGLEACRDNFLNLYQQLIKR